MNHYPRHIGDYLKKTIGLTLLQDGAYNRMLDLYYSEEGPLPLDRADIYTSTRCQGKADRDAVDYVLRKFFTEKADGFHHDRCDEEIATYRERSASASQSAQKRWSERNANAYANAMRTHSDGNANHKPLTTNQKKNTPKPPPAAPVGVRPEVWESWQRARGKKLTPDAVALQAKRLAQFAASGDDPNEVIEQSIRNTWAGLFPIKRATGPPVRAPTLAEKRTATMDAITGKNRNGRDITSTAERVDRAPVRSLPGDLRQPDGDGVG